MEKRTPVKELLRSTAFGSQVHVKGWVQTKREGKNVAFIALNDGSCMNNIQVVMKSWIIHVMMLAFQSMPDTT